jgi:ABC-type glycerol-3-phosphate transport system substrate-binding protein
MVMPVYGKGKMAGKPILDSQGLGISTNAEDPQAAAAFLEYLNSPERLQAFLGEDRMAAGQHWLRHLGHHR